MSHFPRFSLLLFMASLAACSGRRDIREFYYPLEKLAAGQVYEYAAVGADSIPPDYWYFRAAQKDGTQFLLATYYDANLEIGQTTREKIGAGGARTEEYAIFFADSSGRRSLRVQAALESPDVFPFSVKDSLGVFLFHLKFQPPGDAATTLYLIRNRRYLGDAPDFEFQEKKYPCIRFGLREVVGNSAEGDAEVENRGEEWYAQGLGLVYYRKESGNGELHQEFRLYDVFPITELERRAGRRFGVE